MTALIVADALLERKNGSAEVTLRNSFRASELPHYVGAELFDCRSVALTEGFKKGLDSGYCFWDNFAERGKILST